MRCCLNGLVGVAFVWMAIGSVQVGFGQSTDAPSKLKRLPPAGIEIDSADRTRLQARSDDLRAKLEQAAADSADADRWRADIEVLVRAVDLALTQNLFFKQGQIADAEELLDEAARRIKAAASGIRGLELLGFDESRNGEPQPLVGGFVSRIDDSVQPFGIVVPAGFAMKSVDTPHRVDVWLHGRGDTKTEIPFLTERMSKPGQYTPANTFVLHPFGRHCNAFKFAGETDVYESIDQARSLIAVDERRIAIRGFSMGGAGCWHLAVHNPGQWFAANPGAGFVDTLVYQGWSDRTPFELTPIAEKLLRWYDVLPWTENLSGTRTIAYSGEVDRQKQAADRVVRRASELGIEFPYVIGEGMGHKIDPASAAAIDAQLANWAAESAPQPVDRVRFATYTLRYDRAHWIRVTGMREHFARAAVDASLDREGETIAIETDGVTHLEIDFAESGWPGRKGDVDLTIDGVAYSVADSGNRRGFQCAVQWDGDQWTVSPARDAKLRKRPGMQGPIDDAFCDRFVVVLPSRPARHGKVQRWINREQQYFENRWERLMRGEVRVVMDHEVSEDLIETSNLICFGDFSSNRFLFDISSQLPVEWTRERLRVGEREFDPVNQVPVFCFPNPMNPDRYVVVNSGMTYREFSNTSNSRQIAMLPDWAILDVDAEDDSIYAGRIVDQGFFDESWKLERGAE